MQDLEEKLKRYAKDIPKIIAFESVYSMCGSVSPINEVGDLARKYGPITFNDEVHAVGMYGPLWTLRSKCSRTSRFRSSFHVGTNK